MLILQMSESSYIYRVINVEQGTGFFGVQGQCTIPSFFDRQVLYNNCERRPQNGITCILYDPVSCY
jgi:hypothetical protein